MSSIAVVIVLYNAKKLIPELINTLISLPAELDVFVYDSGSTDNSIELFKKSFTSATIIEGANFGFGYGNNRCIDLIKSDYTLFLNSDATIDSNSLAKLVDFLDKNLEFAAVQPLLHLCGYNLVTASAGVFITEYGEAYDSKFMHLELYNLNSVIQVAAVTAALSLYRTEALKSVNGFDEDYFMYFEDADLSLRLGAKGWKFAVLRDAEGFHKVGASSSRKQAKEWELYSSMRLYRRFLGKGKLSAFWWARELKICMYSIFHRKHFFWRVKLYFKSLFKKVSIVTLPEELKAILYGEPINMPFSRPHINSNSLSISSTSNINIASPWIALFGITGKVELELTAVNYSVTGIIISETAVLLQRFCISSGASHQLQLVTDSSIIYIHCDNKQSRLRVKIL